MVRNLPELPQLFGRLGLRGEVALSTVDEKQVVVKCFSESTQSDRRYKELDLLRQLRHHQNIVTLLAAGPDIQNGLLGFVITELAPEGDLHCREYSPAHVFAFRERSILHH